MWWAGGIQKGVVYQGRAGEKYTVDMLPKTKLELVVSDTDTDKAVDIIVAAARTGNIGDGKIFISPITQVIRVRTGDRGDGAL